MCWLWQTGQVIKAEYHEAYGYFIQLEHEDGIQTLYAHLQELLAAPGDTVKQGQIIGLSGSSGWSDGFAPAPRRVHRRRNG